MPPLVVEAVAVGDEHPRTVPALEPPVVSVDALVHPEIAHLGEPLVAENGLTILVANNFLTNMAVGFKSLRV